jgi:hypothetical protein
MSGPGSAYKVSSPLGEVKTRVRKTNTKRKEFSKAVVEI